MQLSILIGTSGTGLLPCSRIMQACSWASPQVEVIVRDVSGDAQKRELLASLRGEQRNIILAEPCDARTNFLQALRQAKGDFVFQLTDDDLSFDHAIAALPPLIEQHGQDPSVIGVTGAYVVETDQGSSIVVYANAEADDVTARASGYLSVGGPNLFRFAPVRRDVVQRVFGFMDTLPFNFPFHDQLVSLLYLLNGRFVRLKRFLYLYDPDNREAGDAAQKRDADCYRDAGLDPVVNLLHWYLCGFEGAVLVRNANEFPDYSLAQRQAVADRWFSSMFIRFKGWPRLTFDSPFTAEAQKICAKLQTSTGQISFDGMLAEICALFALFSQDGAQRYFDFWQAMINQRQPVLVPGRMQAERRAVGGA
jgi:hypothetical protein